MGKAKISAQEFYNSLVSSYLQEEQKSPHSQVGQLDYYKDLSIELAIDNAVFGRYVVNDFQFFSTHYKYFPQHVGKQENAREELLNIQSSLQKARDFMEVYDLVRAAVQPVAPGKLGLLFFYDTALRIAASSKFFPTKVFLQAGAFDGAEAAGLNLQEWSRERPYLDPSVFYKLSDGLRDLAPMDIETLFCIRKGQIAKFMNFKKSTRRQLENQ